MPDTISIKAVAKLTGLTTHAIRAWEKRYGAIEPARTKGRHRMYGVTDVQRLKLLAEATRAGKAISRIVKLDNVQLRSLLESVPAGSLHRPAEELKGPLPGEGFLAEGELFEKAMRAIASLDTRAMDHIYTNAQSMLGDQGLLRLLVAPLAHHVGTRWREGKITAAQEHFFTAISKAYLWNLTRQFEIGENAPRIVVGTPAGQIHDLGAVIVAAAAANNGWRVSFVGASLPAFELAGAVRLTQAQALALSVVYPEDDPGLGSELNQLRRLLPDGTRLFVGGRAAPAYAPALQKCGARVLSSLEDFDAELDSLRRLTQANPHNS
jgi:DNA-binding transcriptional MerR regulator/methylmalonyl-CoA mutase cobalamin-binding subunit